MEVEPMSLEWLEGIIPGEWGEHPDDTVTDKAWWSFGSNIGNTIRVTGGVEVPIIEAQEPIPPSSVLDEKHRGLVAEVLSACEEFTPDITDRICVILYPGSDRLLCVRGVSEEDADVLHKIVSPYNRQGIFKDTPSGNIVTIV